MAFRKSVSYSAPRVAQALRLDVRDLLPTQGDILFALQRQKSRILDRTQRGLDFEERPFAPYSTKGPYYFYPNGPVGKQRDAGQAKRDRTNVKRFAAKIGRPGVTRSGLGLKFPSYAAFKLQYLGRSNVDLTGPRAPHMLQAILTTVAGTSFFGEQNVGLTAFPGTALEGSIGIFGDPGKRASGHNTGTGRGLPQRRFFAASQKDNTAFAEDLKSRGRERRREKFGFRDVA